MEELEEYNVATAPKTGTFQMRINPQIKERVENIYAASGMTLTDAINTFIQQSINVEGLPFVTKNSKEALRQQAIAQLMIELKKGEDSVKNEAEWIPEEEVLNRLGVKE